MAKAKYFLIREDYSTKTKNATKPLRHSAFKIKLIEDSSITSDSLHEQIFNNFNAIHKGKFPVTIKIDPTFEIIIESEAAFLVSHLIITEISKEQYYTLAGLFPDCIDSFNRSGLLEYC